MAAGPDQPGENTPDDRVWMAAKYAADLVETVHKNRHDATETIIEWAAAGLVATRAKRVLHFIGDESNPSKGGDGLWMAPEFWERFRDHTARAREAWPSGDFTLRRFDSGNPRGLPSYTRALAVEFCETEIRLMPGLADGAPAVSTFTDALKSGLIGTIDVDGVPRPVPLAESAEPQRYGYFAKIPPPPPPTPAAPTPSLELAPAAKKRISDATLNAWWEMCKTVKSASVWDADSLRVFFDQCFPDKFLSRDRLRDLRGTQKPGPKGKTAE